MSNSLDETIKASRVRMECLVGFYERKLETERRLLQRATLAKQATKARARLTFFNAVSGSIKAPFRLATLPYTPADKAQQKAVKREWRDMREAAFKQVAQGQRARLKRMNLSDPEIDRMAENGARPYRKGKPLDLTFDHKVPVSMGGGNDFENIQLMPRYLNHMFEWFTKIQVPDEQTLSIVNLEVECDEPIDPNVLIIPGGFGPKNHNRNHIRKKCTDALGMEVPL